MALGVGCIVVGAALLVAGVVFLVRPRVVAHLNDTTGPAWVRNWNRAPGQTSKPWQMIIVGVVLLFAGAVLILTGAAMVGFDPLHLT